MESEHLLTAGEKSPLLEAQRIKPTTMRRAEQWAQHTNDSYSGPIKIWWNKSNFYCLLTVSKNFNMDMHSDVFELIDSKLLCW